MRVVLVLCECPANKDSRDSFMVKLWVLLGESFKNVDSLGNEVFLCVRL